MLVLKRAGSKAHSPLARPLASLFNSPEDSGGALRKCSTPLSSSTQLNADDNASDAFSFGLSADSEGYKEIQPTNQESGNDEVVAEFEVVDGELCLEESKSAIGDTEESWSQEHDEEEFYEECEEGSALKKRKTVEKSMTAQELKGVVEAKIASRIDYLWQATTFPQRVCIATDVKVTVDPRTLVAKGSARCLLCDKVWCAVQLSGYTYQVHNYKRHITKFHINPKKPVLAKDTRGRGGAKAALDKASKDVLQQPVSSFFTRANESTKESTVTKNKVNVLRQEELDITTGTFYSVPTNNGVKMCSVDSGAPEEGQGVKQGGELDGIDQLISDLTDGAESNSDSLSAGT